MFGSSPGNTVGSLTATQHSVLVGSLLGDGSLRIQGRGSRRINALLEVNHSVQFKEYVDWKHEVFRSYVLTPPKPRSGNGTRVAYRFTTQSLPVFTDYFRWFYGDGSQSRSACYLNTQQFTSAEQSFLIDRLAQTYGIESHLNRDKQYFRLRITTRGTRKLMDLIGPFILPCFRYKLLDDPVTTDPKGEAPDAIRGNTPTLAVPTEAMHAPC